MIVYHYTSARNGLDNIDRRRLKIATIPDLNDPFELLCVDMSEQTFRDSMRAWKAELGKVTGMLCFSENWKNPVQWSHYAEKHRGLCLKFEIPATFIEKVTYDDKRSINEAKKLMKDRTTDPKAVTKMLTTKFAHWHYEDEWRSFLRLNKKDPVSGLYFFNWDANVKLTGVLIGAESEVRRDQVQAVLRELEPQVELQNMRLAFKTFEVCQQLDETLWK
jgi:Protein of unknown function (DUF2971)